MRNKKIDAILEVLMNDPDAVAFWIAEDTPEIASATHITETKKEAKQEVEINP